MNRELERKIDAQLNWERAKRAPLGVFGFMVIGLMVVFFVFFIFGKLVN